MHTFVRRALRTALVTGGLVVVGAGAAHAAEGDLLGDLGLDVSVEAPLSQVTEVLLSKHEFDEYQRLKRQATRALWVHDLSNETLDRLAASTMDERHADLDALMAG